MSTRLSLGRAYKIEDDEEDRQIVLKRLKLSATAFSSAPKPSPTLPPPPPSVLSPERVHHTSGFSEEEYSERSQYSDEDQEHDEEQEESENYQEDVIEEVINQQTVVVNEETSSDRRSLTLTLTDPDLLDCPICFENLNIPVYQCGNGHIACDSCCLKIKHKCPTCSSAIGYNRCWPIEKLLQAVQVSCINIKYGCKNKMKYLDKLQHENSCIYSPCFCPVLECDFTDSASNLYTHFPSKHAATDFVFNCRFNVFLERNISSLFLREETSGTLFVLNQLSEYQGDAVNVVLIAPESPVVKYCYEIQARDGETSLTLQSPVECVPDLGDYRPAKHVLIVEDFRRPVGYLELNICIYPYEER